MASRGNSPYEVKQGDLEPSVDAVLMQSNNQPIDLSLATAVYFYMRLRGTTAGSPIGGQAVIVQAGGDDTANFGSVRYDWTTGDTSVPGVYDAEFKIDWGGREQRVPNDEYLSVQILTSIS